MEIIDVAGAVAGMGGTGVLARALIPKLGEAHKERMADKHNAFAANNGATSKARAFFQPVALHTGAFVHRGFAICAFIILMAPILMPLLGNIVIEYYWPKDLDFFVFETTKMKALVAGTPVIDERGNDISRHIMILPIHITASMNMLSFYLTGKALK